MKKKLAAAFSMAMAFTTVLALASEQRLTNRSPLSFSSRKGRKVPRKAIRPSSTNSMRKTRTSRSR